MDALVIAVSAIPSINGNAVQVFSQDDVEKAQKEIRPPFVVIHYAGRRRGVKPMATIARFSIGAVGLDRCRDPGGEIRDLTTDILDDIVRYIGRTTAVASGHKYEFDVETPVDLPGGLIGYEQIWTTRINPGQRPSP